MVAWNSSFYMEGKSGFEAARCGRVVAVQMEGPMEAVDSLTRTGFRAFHRKVVSRVRIRVQNLRKMSVKLVETAGRGSVLTEVHSLEF